MRFEVLWQPRLTICKDGINILARLFTQNRITVPKSKDKITENLFLGHFRL